MYLLFVRLIVQSVFTHHLFHTSVINSSKVHTLLVFETSSADPKGHGNFFSNNYLDFAVLFGDVLLHTPTFYTFNMLHSPVQGYNYYILTTFMDYENVILGKEYKGERRIS